jgi:hypothetical protein
MPAPGGEFLLKFQFGMKIRRRQYVPAATAAGTICRADELENL